MKLIRGTQLAKEQRIEDTRGASLLTHVSARNMQPVENTHLHRLQVTFLMQNKSRRGRKAISEAEETSGTEGGHLKLNTV